MSLVHKTFKYKINNKGKNIMGGYMIKYLMLSIYTFSLFILLSIPIAQSASSDEEKYDERRDIGQKSQQTSPTTGAEMQNNPALVDSTSPSGVKTAPSTVNPSSPDGVNPLNPAGVDQSSPTGGTGGSTGY